MQKKLQLKTDQPSSPKQPQKKPYEKPRVVRQGRLEEMTLFTANPGPSSVPSDRKLKENLSAVDVHAVLEKLAEVPISTWNYKSDFGNIRHMGPMAQDFAYAFGLGNTDCVIHNVDSGGVTMAAIQALYHLAHQQSERITALEAEIREMRAVTA